jgi:hypothetical protein
MDDFIQPNPFDSRVIQSVLLAENQQLRARIAQLEQKNVVQLGAIDAGLNRISHLEGESKQHLEWATTWHDALCVVATVLEVPTADTAQMLKTGIVECIRDMTADNQRLKLERDGLSAESLAFSASCNELRAENQQLKAGILDRERTCGNLSSRLAGEEIANANLTAENQRLRAELAQVDIAAELLVTARKVNQSTVDTAMKIAGGCAPVDAARGGK